MQAPSSLHLELHVHLKKTNYFGSNAQEHCELTSFTAVVFLFIGKAVEISFLRYVAIIF